MRKLLSDTALVLFLLALITCTFIAAIDDIKNKNRKPNILECPRPAICEKVK